jgi:hypothetical protein
VPPAVPPPLAPPLPAPARLTDEPPTPPAPPPASPDAPPELSAPAPLPAALFPLPAVENDPAEFAFPALGEAFGLPANVPPPPLVWLLPPEGEPSVEPSVDAEHAASPAHSTSDEHKIPWGLDIQFLESDAMRGWIFRVVVLRGKVQSILLRVLAAAK